jgi:hypothetical protein
MQDAVEDQCRRDEEFRQWNEETPSRCDDESRQWDDIQDGRLWDEKTPPKAKDEVSVQPALYVEEASDARSGEQ